MPKKTNRTTVTNPAASRLPKPLGEYQPNPPTPDPVTPKLIPTSRQLAPTKRVTFTNRRASERP
jgi:hypothetical protein